MRFLSKGRHIVNGDGLEVAVATDEAWANTIATVLDGQPEQVAALREISKLTTSLDGYLRGKAWADDKTGAILDGIREKVTKASHRLQKEIWI